MSHNRLLYPLQLQTLYSCVLWAGVAPFPPGSQSLAMVSPWETCWCFLSPPSSSIPGRRGQEDLIFLPPANSHLLVEALLQVQKHESTGAPTALPQLTHRVRVPHHEGGAEKMRDSTPFPPASATHGVGMSLLEKKVPTPGSGAVEQGFFPEGSQP